MVTQAQQYRRQYGPSPARQPGIVPPPPQPQQQPMQQKQPVSQPMPRQPAQQPAYYQPQMPAMPAPTPAPPSQGQLSGFQPGVQLDWQGAGSRRDPEYVRQLLGPLGQAFPQGAPILQGDIALIEAGLNYQQLEQALMDRARGVEALTYAQSVAGEGPEALLAKELAAAQATGAAGPFSDAQIATRRRGLISENNMARENALQNMEAGFARRNIGGGAPALEMAMLDQASRQGLAAQLGDFEQDVALARQQAQQQGLAQLSQMSTFEESMENELMRSIADAYLETQRGPIDLSALIEPPEHPEWLIGRREQPI